MPGLKRALSLPELIVYGVGSMVGAGIYSIIGVAAIEVGSSLWLSFILASVAAGITVLSYAELSSMYPRAGAEFQFLKHAFPKWPYFSFMAGFLIALNAAATSATVALAFAGYLKVFVNNSPLITAFSLLAICTLINIAGIKQTTWTNIILVTIEVSGLLIIIWVGFANGDVSKPFHNIDKIIVHDISSILSAAALIFFVFIGFEDVANLSEETKNPLKTVPKALIYSVIITSIIYILVAFAFIAISNEEIFKSSSPLSSAISSLFPRLGNIVAISALFATTSTALISLVSISRMLFGMAREGAMPKLFSRILPKRRTPWIAAIFLFIWACILLLFNKIQIIASVASVGVLLVFDVIQVATITLRFTQKNKIRGFKIPLSVYDFPLLPALGIIVVSTLLLKFDFVVYVIVGATIMFGTCIYLLLVRNRGRK